MKRALSTIATAGLLTSSAWAAEKPNVLFIMIDDSEFIEYGCYGGEVLTPNIDKLASEGVLFTRGFTSSSVCTPTRYTCLSGKYASRSHSLKDEEQQPANMSSFIRWNTHLVSGGNNVASVLQKNGYATGVVGKWHIGHSEEYDEKVANIPGVQYETVNHAVAAGDPKGDRNMRGGEQFELTDPDFNRYLRAKYDIATEDIRNHYGFDYVGSFYSANLTDYPKSMKKFYEHNQDWMTAGAIDFIDQQAASEQPFFLYFSSTLQHGPEPRSSIDADRRITAAGYIDEAPDVQPDYHSIYKRLNEAGIPRSAAPMLWLDDSVGAVMDRLKKHDMLENTLVILFSDQQSWGKASIYDGGVNTPLIMNWPKGLPKAEVNSEMVGNIDFVPTIFAACGVTPPKDMLLDGLNILPMVRGEVDDWREALFFELGDMRGVRTKNFKYIATRNTSDEDWAKLPKEIQESQEFRQRYFKLGKEWNYGHISNSPIGRWRYAHRHVAAEADQLFDLRSDPTEVVNQYGVAAYKKTARHMRKLLSDWLQTMPGSYAEFKPAK